MWIFHSFLTVENFKRKIINNGFLQIFIVQRFAPRSSFCWYWIRKGVSKFHSFFLLEWKKKKSKKFISFHCFFFFIYSEKEKDPVLQQAGKQAAIASINVFNDVMDGKNVTDALLDRYVRLCSIESCTLLTSWFFPILVESKLWPKLMVPFQNMEKASWKRLRNTKKANQLKKLPLACKYLDTTQTCITFTKYWFQ